VAKLAKCLSNHVWTKRANLSSQFIATIALKRLIPDKQIWG